jgi:IclR family mhp operon transcriptional activator
MPVRVQDEVLACVNLTWRKTVMSAAEAAKRHLADLRTAVRRIEELVTAARSTDSA